MGYIKFNIEINKAFFAPRPLKDYKIIIIIFKKALNE